MSGNSFRESQLRGAQNEPKIVEENALESPQRSLKKFPTFIEFREYQEALQAIENNCSLTVGMQMETRRESGKRLIKEKAFHVIYEAEQELIYNPKLQYNVRMPADDAGVQQLQKEGYRKVFKKCRKVIMAVERNQNKFVI